MDMVRGANPTAEPLRRTTQMEPKIEAVCASREAEVNLSYYLKPPDLLKVCNTLESEKTKIFKIILVKEIGANRYSMFYLHLNKG